MLGQKTFASRVGNYQWVYSKTIWAEIAGRYSYSFDTMPFQFNGKEYFSFGEPNIKVADSGTKVYGLKGTNEYLLMDYSLNIGDTLRTIIGSNTFQLQFRKKSKIKIEGDSLWSIELKSVAYPTNVPPLVWIESIGCPNGYHPLNWPSIMGMSDIGYQLNCVLHADTSILKQIGKNCALENALINPNKKWYTWASNDNGDLKFSVPYYFTSRDTLINGKKYQTMNQPMRFVRYDTIAGKYYILSNKLGEEIMVYNAKAKVGDTMFSTSISADTVTKISYGWLQNEYRKIYTTTKDVFLSGIGSQNRVMWDQHLVTFPEYQAGNICYGEFASIKYHFPYYFQNKEQCDITSSIYNASKKTLSFFPNPVQSTLNLSSADKQGFKIRNSLGTIVLEGVCEGKIYVETLPQGIYFLELLDKSGSEFYKFQK